MMRKRILIVDDQQDSLDLMRELLEPEGYEVLTQAHVDDIFKEIAQLSPDLILLDFLLSGINGGELCAQIKKNEETRHIPVIFLSAHTRVLESLGHYGYDDFIAKPFGLAELLNKVSRQLA